MHCTSQDTSASLGLMVLALRMFVISSFHEIYENNHLQTFLVLQYIKPNRGVLYRSIQLYDELY